MCNLSNEEYSYLESIMKLDLKENRSVFDSISRNHLYENYHSDILAYYLTFDIVKEKIIYWINQNKSLSIRPELYTNIINNRRELGHRDITIYSKPDRTGVVHAIVVENKSNDAGDMDDQISTYYDELSNNEHVMVDGILYLNKYIAKDPEGVLDWKNSDKIEPILVSATLNGQNGFIENVIDPILNERPCISDSRVLGLSIELKEFFKIVVDERYEISGMKENDFIEDVLENNNLKKVKTIYERLPYIIRNRFIPYISNSAKAKFEKVIVKKCSTHLIGYCLDIIISGITYTVEFHFKDIYEKSITVRVCYRDFEKQNFSSKYPELYNDLNQRLVSLGFNNDWYYLCTFICTQDIEKIIDSIFDLLKDFEGEIKKV